MLIISHRANLKGSNPETENKPENIDLCINLGFDVEIDVRYINNKLFLGHDDPQYEVDLNFLLTRANKLWIHCKDYSSLEYFNNLNKYELKDIELNYFYHTDEDYVLTSKKNVWVFPGKKLLKNSICVLPEIYPKDKEYIQKDIYGICTDYPYLYN